MSQDESNQGTASRKSVRAPERDPQKTSDGLEVDGALRDIQEQIEVVTARVMELQNRLEPVMLPREDKAAPLPAASYGCPLAYSLNMSTIDLVRISQVLYDILTALQV